MAPSAAAAHHPINCKHTIRNVLRAAGLDRCPCGRGGGSCCSCHPSHRATRVLAVGRVRACVRERTIVAVYGDGNSCVAAFDLAAQLSFSLLSELRTG